MPGRTSILALSLLIAAAALGACDGDDASDGLIAIDGREGESEPLSLEAQYNPSFAGEYPDVVAEVNGEPILGEELAVKVAQEIATRWHYESGGLAEQSGAPQDFIDELAEELAETDPLEELIDRKLLAQEAERRGLMPTYEEAVEYTRAEEQRFLSPSPSRSVEDAFALLNGLEAVGYPRSDWASDPEIVEMHRNTLGVVELRKRECLVMTATPGHVNLVGKTDCTSLIAELRAEAEVVYYVRWAG